MSPGESARASQSLVAGARVLREPLHSFIEPACPPRRLSLLSLPCSSDTTTRGRACDRPGTGCRERWRAARRHAPGRRSRRSSCPSAASCGSSPGAAGAGRAAFDLPLLDRAVRLFDVDVQPRVRIHPPANFTTVPSRCTTFCTSNSAAKE